MTERELGFVADGLLLIGPTGGCADDLLARLLEERKRLLEALGRAYPVLCGGGNAPGEIEGAIKQAYDTIAFAEGPFLVPTSAIEIDPKAC